MFYWDPTYILIIIGALICAAASLNVRSTYKKYSKTLNSRGATAEEVARTILQSAGILDVRIERISGSLTDHYSPKEKVLRLSDDVYGSSSVAAIGVAAHECGHAIQHKESYAPLTLRSAAVPVARFGSFLYLPVLILGFVLGYFELVQLGIVLFALIVLFQLITLPVEFNASSRALKILAENNILSGDELTGSKKVLTAAALTYVAALFSAILQLLRLVLLARGGSRRD